MKPPGEQEQMSREERMELTERRMGKIKNKIMVFSGKGGVGKSTVAVNLAAALALKGSKVGILDADIHGPNVPKMLGIEDAKPDSSCSGIHPVEVKAGGTAMKVISLAFFIDKDSPVIWRGPMKMGIIQQFLSEVEWGDLDYLIIDLPPGTGDEALTIAQSVPDVTGSIVVTTPQDVALLDSRKAVVFSQKLNIKVLGIVENMSGLNCPHCGKEIDLFKKGGGEKAAHELYVPFLGAIPLDPQIVSGGDRGLPFISDLPDSDVAKAFNKIVEELLK
ncbi:MAG: Mrp/NBP35 family ATP-binding protein [Candidatus Altiarchaeia archaeon]